MVALGDHLALRRGALPDEARLLDAGVFEVLLVRRDLPLERDHLVHHGDVLRRHRLQCLDPVDEIVDALRAEEHRKRRLLVPRRVDDDEPLLERHLRLAEIRPRRVQRLAVDLQAALDPVEPRAGRVVGAGGPLDAPVELLKPAQDLLGLRLFGGDRGVAGRSACRDSRPQLWQ